MVDIPSTLAVIPEELEVSPYQAAQLACIRRIRELQTAIGVGRENVLLQTELREATDELWHLTRRLVRYTINRCLRTQGETVITVDDLENEGALVLMKAIDGYNEELGAFSTYLSVAVRRRVTEVLMASGGTIKISPALLQKVSKARREFRAEHGRDAEPEELASYGVTTEDLALISRARGVFSGSQEYAGNDEGKSLESDFADGREEMPDAIVEREDLISGIVGSVDRLSEVDRRAPMIVRARFGIREDGALTGETRTFEAIGRDLGISTERVRQIFDRALRQMQEWFEEGTPTTKQATAIPTPVIEQTASISVLEQIEQAQPVAAIPIPAPQVEEERPHEAAALRTAEQRYQLLEFIHRSLRNQVPEEHRRTFDLLCQHPHTRRSYGDLLPQGAAATQWRKKTVGQSIQTVNEVLGGLNHDCGVILRDEGLHQEEGFMFIHDSAVPFHLAQRLTLFQWQVLDYYARRDRRIVHDDEACQRLWGKEEYKGLPDSKLLQRVIWKIREYLNGDGYHIIPTDKIGAERGYALSLDSNIPPSLRLSLDQAVVINKLLFAFQRASGDEEAWVDRAALTEALRQAYILLKPTADSASIQPQRQGVTKAIERLQANLGEYGAIETQQEMTGHRIITAARLSRWYQTPEEMASEPSSLLDINQHQPRGGEIPLEVLRSAAYRIALDESHGTSVPAWLPQPLHDRWQGNALTNDDRVALAILFAYPSQSCKAALTACFSLATIESMIEHFNQGFLYGEYAVRNAHGVIGIVRDSMRGVA